MRDTSGYALRMAYNDGRTDGRTFCRNHTQEERATELQTMQAAAHCARNANEQRYHDGYIEILTTWVDGIGA